MENVKIYLAMQFYMNGQSSMSAILDRPIKDLISFFKYFKMFKRDFLANRERTHSYLQNLQISLTNISFCKALYQVQETCHVSMKVLLSHTDSIACVLAYL